MNKKSRLYCAVLFFLTLGFFVQVSSVYAAEISGRIWIDANKNGVQDIDEEEGVPGLQIRLYFDNILMATTTSDAIGQHAFYGLWEGNWQVRVLDPDNVLGGLTPTINRSTNGNDGNGMDSNEPEGTAVVIASASDVINTVDFGYASPYVGSSATGATNNDITTDVQDVLSLDCTHDNTANDHIVEFGNLTPGTPVTASTTCTVTTNSDQGYTLAVKRNTIDATMDKDGEDTTNIPDRTAWNPTESGNAQIWNTSDTNLAFTLYNTTATKDTTWWGTGTTQTDANNKYAGFPTDYTNIMNHTQYNQTATTINIGYKLDVPTTQKSGIYSGDITYQVTTAP